MEDNQNWKTKALILGGVFGLLIGLGAAYMLIQRSERSGEKPQLSTGEGVKIGLGVLGLLRLVADIGDEK